MHNVSLNEFHHSENNIEYINNSFSIQLNQITLPFLIEYNVNHKHSH